MMSRLSGARTLLIIFLPRSGDDVDFRIAGHFGH